MQKTKAIKKRKIERKWHLVNAQDKVLGRTASEIGQLLRGKGKPYFVPHLDCGDYVVVINAKEAKITGKKEKQKIYTHYSGYPGGLRRETWEHLRQRKPEELIRRAVSGMLPKNKLRKRWLARLFVFANKHHPYESKLKIRNEKGKITIKN